MVVNKITEQKLKWHGAPENNKADEIFKFRIKIKKLTNCSLLLSKIVQRLQRAEIAEKLTELYFPGNIHHCIVCRS